MAGRQIADSLVPVSFVLAWLTVLAALPAHAQEFHTIAMTGDTSPDDDGIFPTLNDAYSVPALNNAGQVFFTASLFNSSEGATNDTGIFRGTTAGLSLLAREDQLTPDQFGVSPDTLDDLRDRRLSPNDAGQVAFFTRILGDQVGEAGIYRAGSNGSVGNNGLVKIVRGGDPAPIPVGNFYVGTFGQTPALNDAGEVAFWGRLIGTFGGTSDDYGAFRSNGTSVVQIFREGQAAPRGTGTLTDDFSAPKINNQGQVLSRMELSNANDGALLLGNGTLLSSPARRGDAAPNASGMPSGTFYEFGPPAINNLGQVAYWATLLGTSTDADLGIFRTAGSQTVQIVREDQPAPGGNGEVRTFYSPQLNQRGDVLFYAEYRATSLGTDDDGAILRWSNGQLQSIARERGAAPGGGRFAQFEEDDTYSIALNDRGGVAFRAELDLENGGTTLDSHGLFVYRDGLGLTEVIRQGDVLFGSAVTQIDFAANLDGFSDAAGFNNLGQVAFRFELANTWAGIALWSPPLFGDYNENGVVDAADYTVWRDHLGAPAGTLPNDGDGGVIGAAHYQTWKTAFGDTYTNFGSGGFSAAGRVPEPTTAVLLWGTVWSVAGWRQKRVARQF